MPFGKSTDPDQGRVPEGHATIAQRFSVGNPVLCESRPEGTAEAGRKAIGFSRPFGTCPRAAVNPTLKRWAILRRPSGTGTPSNFPKSLPLAGVGWFIPPVLRFRLRPDP